MNRITTGFIVSSLLVTNTLQAAEPEFNLANARDCIRLNKDLNLASQQMLRTEKEKAELASKVRYLEKVIEERRLLIKQLDQRRYQENNDNYNQLIEQFESLRAERKDTIRQYNTQHELHVSQHNSVIRLEQRFSSTCLSNISLSESVYRQACESEDVRWCSAFNFN